MLGRISGFSTRRPWLVVVLWLAVAAAGFGVGGRVFGVLVSDVGVLPGSESGRTAQWIEDNSPSPARLTAVVSGRPADDPALRREVGAAMEAVRAVPGVVAVNGPLASRTTGRALLVEVALAPGEGQEAAARAAADRLRAVDGATVTVAGGPLSEREFTEQAQRDVARAEMLSLPVVLVLLVVVFGGLLAIGLPLLVAVLGTAGTFGVLYAFSAVTDISVYAVQVTTMLAVGLGVDYALLMVSRFREERRADPDVAGAVARTVATAGRTVLFSGLTVAVALLGLTVFPDPFLRSMGLAGTAVVLVDMLAALTLLPALLARFGRRIAPAKAREGGAGFARVARAVQRRPLLTLAAAAAAMAALALPAARLHISLGDPGMLPASTTTHRLWDELHTHFPERARWSDDIQVIAHAAPGDPRVAELRRTVAALPGVAEVRTRGLGPARTLLSAVPRGDADGPAARDAVRALRETRTPVPVEVGGYTARLIDYRAMLADRLPWAAAAVALGTLALLFAFTGSLLLPVKAVLTNLLGIGSALGVVVRVFQDGHLAGPLGTEGTGYVHLTVPMLIGAIAFGLSVDYEVFLLSRIRERWLAGDAPSAAVAEGLRRTGGIVTAAALTIAVVFAGFAFGGFAPVKAIGLGLVTAIVLDATVVRILLVPATMTLLGRRNWWLPGPLRRLHARVALSEAVPPPPAGAAAPDDRVGVR